MRLESKAAVTIVTFRNPPKLASLLDNMRATGVPDIPVRVFEDPSPYADQHEISSAYVKLCMDKGVEYQRAPKWGCMQGVTEYAMQQTCEDWIIWVPDDVRFTPGGLWNEYAGILTYGRDFVGGIQAPYWIEADLIKIIGTSSFDLDKVPQNPFWNHRGLPRAYVNLNGAGFSINRELWKRMKGFPQSTWRLDEYAGYMAWKLGFIILTLPGQPRIHELGGSTSYGVPGHRFHTAEAFEGAIGKSIGDATGEIYNRMGELEGGQWPEILGFFQKGGNLGGVLL